MSLFVFGLLAGVAFACGLNLYLAVATLGVLSRFGLLDGLPAGLQGLEGGIVITSALVLYSIEAIIDKIHHADSLWDAVHTFVRPPAAALLAVGALWGEPTRIMVLGAAAAFGIALTAHGTKAGLRLALNATSRNRWHVWISVAEDLLAVAFAVCALRFPGPTLIAVGVMLLVNLAFGPRLWRAFRFGLRAIVAWLRAIFIPARWRDLDELPRVVRALLDDTPLGAAPPRSARAALLGVKGVGPFRNGWLSLTVHGPVFVYRTPFGARRVDLPPPRSLTHQHGVWADMVRVQADDDDAYTLFMLKDGPDIELAIQHIGPTPA